MKILINIWSSYDQWGSHQWHFNQSYFDHLTFKRKFAHAAVSGILSVENYFRNLSVLDGCSVVVPGCIWKLESHFSARRTIDRHFSQTFCAVVRIQALMKERKMIWKIRSEKNKTILIKVKSNTQKWYWGLVSIREGLTPLNSPIRLTPRIWQNSFLFQIIFEHLWDLFKQEEIFSISRFKFLFGYQFRKKIRTNNFFQKYSSNFIKKY